LTFDPRSFIDRVISLVAAPRFLESAAPRGQHAARSHQQRRPSLE
jgi:hypothetical protein